MKVAIAVNLQRPHQLSAARAFSSGCARHGDEAEILGIRPQLSKKHCTERFDALCCWGWHQGEVLRRSGKNVLIMERGYMVDRMKWFSLGWNGLNGRAVFPRVDDAGARWRQHFAQFIHPWRNNREGYALLLGQVPADQAVCMVDFEQWANSMARQLAQLGHNVRFRPHPQALDVRVPVPQQEGTLADALAGAAFAVTWNSNSGVDAVLSGIPALTMDIGAMAWEVTSHDPTAPLFTPDRTAWSHRMAYTQWLPEEIERGEAWEFLRQMV